MMKKYVFTATGLMSLYLLNRFWWIPHSGGVLHRVLSCWFADFLAGGMMMVVLFAALRLANRPHPKPILCLTQALCCGLFWEYITPLYLPRSTSDPWDILAVLLGAACLLPPLYHSKR